MIRIENFDLSSRNTFRMKVSCALYIEYENIDELKSIDFASLPQPVISVGEGANILFTGDFPGTVLHSAISYIKYFDMGSDTVPVAVGAGVKWDDLVAKTCADGLWGLENLSGIPGSVGASAVQNVGAYGVEAGDLIAGVTCYDTVTGEKIALKTPDCRFGYRDSAFKNPSIKGRYIITGVLFRLYREPRPKLDYKGLQDLKPSSPMDVREAVLSIRGAKLPDPSEIGSAGSFFKNPVVSAAQFAVIAKDYESVPHFVLDGGFIKVPAAWMIEQCGFKGAVCGGAEVYANQPLVIINATGDATPQDVLELEGRIIEGVRTRFGVELAPEVVHI